MNDRLASYSDVKFHLGSQHNSFCMTHLLWDPMVTSGGVTVFVSGVYIFSYLKVFEQVIFGLFISVIWLDFLIDMTIFFSFII